MSDLYSVIPGLQPSAQELLEGELLCKQILEAKFPDLDLREGTALRDLVLRPSAMLFALMKKAGDFYFTQNTLRGIDNVTPPEVLDSILSNWFLTRNIGIKSVINTRLYFARKKNVSVSANIYFSTDNVSRFFPVESSSYSADSMVFDSYSNEYYVDVDMIAEKEGTQYNISSGSLLYFSNFDPYFLRAEINYLKTESINSETNLEFISRSKTTISTRNLINVPSIDSNLKAAFNYITRLLTIGMGDPEMIRDQIKVIFEPTTARVPVSVIRSGFLITVVLPDHGFNTGQKILLDGAVPENYNGTYVITVIDPSTFTYTIATAPIATIVLPTVIEVNAPVLIHNGGMVDIFCSDKLATSSIQLTTDEFGKTNLTGPIYEFERSTISAGDQDDSIPLIVEKNISGINIVGTTAMVTTSTPHEFLVSDPITISGAIQNQTLTSITSVGITATATLISHGYIVGNKVNISGAIQPAYNGTFIITAVTSSTFTYLINAPVSVAATGTLIANVDLLNGIKTISNITPTTFAFALPQVSAVAVTGTMKASTPVKYSVSNTNLETKHLDGISSAGVEVTVNLSRHGYIAGRYITISNCPVAGYNGTWFIKEVPNPDQFKFDLHTSITNTSLVGTVTSIIPSNDFGFSQKQSLDLNFGSLYANKTVTFTIHYIQNLDSVQAYLDNATNRVLCADYLAKGFNFYKLAVEITSYNGVIPNVSLVESIVSDYLKSLGLGDMFVMSDMVSKLRINGITNIQNPPKVHYKKYTRDLNPVETGVITDVMDPNDRTSVYLLDSVSTFAQNISVTNTAFTI